MFCQVEPSSVIAVHDVSSTYHVPLLLEKQGLIESLSSTLNLPAVSVSPSLNDLGQKTWKSWKLLTSTPDHHFEPVTIALVGKYTNLHDSYLSVIKSLEHASMRCSKKLILVWVDASHLEQAHLSSDAAAYHKAWHDVCDANGILVPGGFGQRGTEGMIAAAHYARTHSKPYLGICLGMQIAVIEFARNVCNIPHASSIELFEQCPDPVIIFMPEISKSHLGGTMRLGLRPTIFQPDSEWSKLRNLYGEADTIQERHRHRYEVNPAYVDALQKAGCEFVGKDDKGERMEIVELKDHPWFVGVQFHPEYLSRVLQPSKPYLGFVAASAGCLDEIQAEFGREKQVNGHQNPKDLTNGFEGVAI
jgi:CTP synthase